MTKVWYAARVSSSNTGNPRRIGRPPVGDEPMTHAERMRRYREKRRERGGRTVTFEVDPAHMQAVRQAARALSTSETDVLRALFAAGLDTVAAAAVRAERLAGDDGSTQAIRECFSEVLQSSRSASRSPG